MATIKKAGGVDEYIAAFPEDTREVLEQIRYAIREVLPDAEEAISYAIPAFMLNGSYVIYFSGYKSHVSIYPIPKGNEALQKAIELYKAGKGTLRFSLHERLPLTLIKRVAKALLKNNLERTTARKTKSKV